jgi:hypothetical protein
MNNFESVNKTIKNRLKINDNFPVEQTTVQLVYCSFKDKTLLSYQNEQTTFTSDFRTSVDEITSKICIHKERKQTDDKKRKKAF